MGEGVRRSGDGGCPGELHIASWLWKNINQSKLGQMHEGSTTELENVFNIILGI